MDDGSGIANDSTNYNILSLNALSKGSLACAENNRAIVA